MLPHPLQLILTNQTLVDILQRSGRVKMVEDVVTTQKPVMTKKRTLLTNFTPEQVGKGLIYHCYLLLSTVAATGSRG